MPNKSKYIAAMGILCGLALTLTMLESVFTAALPAGIRIGLANIAVMSALFAYGPKSAFSIILVKSLFVLFTRGLTAFGMSLCGGIVSFLAILILYKKTKSSLVMISVTGAVTHNFGQIFLAAFITQSINTFLYSPILIIAGVLAGFCTGVVMRITLPFIEKLKIKTN